MEVGDEGGRGRRGGRGIWIYTHVSIAYSGIYPSYFFMYWFYFVILHFSVSVEFQWFCVCSLSMCIVDHVSTSFSSTLPASQ